MLPLLEEMIDVERARRIFKKSRMIEMAVKKNHERG